MPSTPATAPIWAGRTGTADGPRPGSSANLAPTTTGTGNPARPAAAAVPDPRTGHGRQPAPGQPGEGRSCRDRAGDLGGRHPEGPHNLQLRPAGCSEAGQGLPDQ